MGVRPGPRRSSPSGFGRRQRPMASRRAAGAAGHVAAFPTTRLPDRRQRQGVEPGQRPAHGRVRDAEQALVRRLELLASGRLRAPAQWQPTNGQARRPITFKPPRAYRQYSGEPSIKPIRSASLRSGPVRHTRPPSHRPSQTAHPPTVYLRSAKGDLIPASEASSTDASSQVSSTLVLSGSQPTSLKSGCLLRRPAIP